MSGYIERINDYNLAGAAYPVWCAPYHFSVFPASLDHFPIDFRISGDLSNDVKKQMGKTG